MAKKKKVTPKAEKTASKSDFAERMAAARAKKKKK